MSLAYLYAYTFEQLPAGFGAVLGFEEALHRPLLEEAPERYSAQDIAAMFPGDDEDGEDKDGDGEDEDGDGEG